MYSVLVVFTGEACTFTSKYSFCLMSVLEPIYTKRRRQRCDNAAMTLVIMRSLKTMVSLQNELQPYSGETSLLSVKAISLALSQC